MLIRNYLETPLADECIHGGIGLCRHAGIFTDKDIDAPVRFINYTILPPGTTFGLHKHGSDNEFYVVLEGEGIYTEDGQDAPVHAGDIIMNAPGGCHGIRNTTDTDMKLLVFEVSCP